MTLNFLNTKRICFGINIAYVIVIFVISSKMYSVIHYFDNPLLTTESVYDIYRFYLGLQSFLIFGLIVLNTFSFFEKYKVGSVLSILLLVFVIVKLI